MTANPDSTVGTQAMRGVTTSRIAHKDDIRHFIPLDPIQPSTLRQSNIGTYFTCARMFLFKERLGLVPGGHTPPPFIGQMFHLAHSARYRGLDDLSVEHVVSQAVNDYLEGLQGWAEETGNIDLAATLSSAVEKDAALAKIMSDLHWKKYPLDASRFQVVALEKEYTAKVDQVVIPLGGRLDLVLRHLREPKGLVIVDHKTTTLDFQEFMVDSLYATQPRIYRVLLEKRPPERGPIPTTEPVGDGRGEPVVGMVHDLVLRPKIRWKSWQTFDDYKAEILDWYEGRADPVGTGEAFKSGPRKGRPKPRWDHSDNAVLWQASPPMQPFFTIFAEPLVPDDLMGKLLVVSRACGCAPRLANFPTTGQDAGRCRQQYGRPCPYRAFCSTDPQNWEDVAARSFRSRASAEDATEIEDLM